RLPVCCNHSSPSKIFVRKPHTSNRLSSLRFIISTAAGFVRRALAHGVIMLLLRVSHPPAGAITMIVSLGIISKPEDLVTIQVAVILLTAQAFVIKPARRAPVSHLESESA